MNLLELPDCVLDGIFQHLSYDEIAKKRLVSTKINKICQSLLNRGVLKLKSRIVNLIKETKPLLPRKQSERWDHAANKKIRFLESIRSNVSLLSLTYDMYSGTNHCCFIAGKVIDLSLYMLKRETYPEFSLSDSTLVELTDTICMAKEHFREQIEPKLKDEQHIALRIQALMASSDSDEEPEDLFDRIFRPTLKASTQKAEETPVATPMDIQENSKKYQFQDRGNCRNAYLRLNRKYSAVLSQVRSTNKKYGVLLRKVNWCSKAITKQAKQLTNARKAVADLRQRLQKCEARNRGANVQQTDADHVVKKTDLKKALRSSKRLADKKKTINEQMDVE